MRKLTQIKLYKQLLDVSLCWDTYKTAHTCNCSLWKMSNELWHYFCNVSINLWLRTRTVDGNFVLFICCLMKLSRFCQSLHWLIRIFGRFKKNRSSMPNDTILVTEQELSLSLASLWKDLASIMTIEVLVYAFDSILSLQIDFTGEGGFQIFSLFRKMMWQFSNNLQGKIKIDQDQKHVLMNYNRNLFLGVYWAFCLHSRVMHKFEAYTIIRDMMSIFYWVEFFHPK